MKNRFFVILFILLIIISLLIIILPRSHSIEKVIQIIQNKEVIYTINLNKVDEPYDITIYSEDGGYNIISIENGSVSVTSSDCADHICINQGKIKDNSSNPIVCLPHKLIIKLISAQDNAHETDIISGRQ